MTFLFVRRQGQGDRRLSRAGTADQQQRVSPFGNRFLLPADEDGKAVFGAGEEDRQEGSHLLLTATAAGR